MTAEALRTPSAARAKALAQLRLAERQSAPGLLTMAWQRFRRDKLAMAGTAVLILLIALAASAPLLARHVTGYTPEQIELGGTLKPPGYRSSEDVAVHWLGTDELGRDVLTRAIYGGRVSLYVSVLAVLISLTVGTVIGAIAGFYGSWVDNVLMRITDAVLAFPPLLVLIMLSAVVRDLDVPFIEGNNVVVIAVVIGILGWMTVARLVRATYLTIREVDFVTAAHSMGASTLRIMVVEILPNAIGPIIVESTLEVAWAIMTESGLSFLGFGIMPPTPSWGNLLSEAQGYMTLYPWLAIFPGLMIFFTIISINYIGDGLRDAFDPHKVIGRVK